MGLKDMTNPVGSVEADKPITEFGLPKMGWLYVLTRLDPDEIQTIAELMPNDGRKALIEHIDVRLQHDDRLKENEFMRDSLEETRSKLLEVTDL